MFWWLVDKSRLEFGLLELVVWIMRVLRKTAKKRAEQMEEFSAEAFAKPYTWFWLGLSAVIERRYLVEPAMTRF